MNNFLLKKFPDILKDIPDQYDTNMAEKHLYKYDGMVEFVYSIMEYSR